MKSQPLIPIGTHFSIRLTLPKTEENPYNLNQEIAVVCESLPRAIQIALEKYPNGKFHSVFSRGEIHVSDIK